MESCAPRRLTSWGGKDLPPAEPSVLMVTHRVDDVDDATDLIKDVVAPEGLVRPGSRELDRLRQINRAALIPIATVLKAADDPVWHERFSADMAQANGTWLRVLAASESLRKSLVVYRTLRFLLGCADGVG